MADADEDTIPQSMGPSAEDDLEDETQDFRFLAQLTSSSSRSSNQAVIPKRGTKDFEPNSTRSQASSLEAARLAMHTALSSDRVHVGRSHIVGQYMPDEEDWKWDEDPVTGARHGRCVVIDLFKSTHAKVVGRADGFNRTWLLPEEALYLLERGILDIRWPDNEKTEVDTKAIHANIVTGDDEDSNTADPTPRIKAGTLPMSLQGAYASFIGKDGLTLERYSVYAGLKRSGYVVQRAPTWHDVKHRPHGVGNSSVHPPTSLLPTATNPAITITASQPRQAISGVASLVHRLVSYLFTPQRGPSCSAYGPIVAPGLYRNYADIFRSLSLIPLHSLSPTSIPSQNELPHSTGPQPPYQIHLHVWKPLQSTSFRKTAPPPPDYRITVIDARTTMSIPTLGQLAPLLDSQPDDALPVGKGRLETRIKHGQRNVLLAVVDAGVVSYLRLADAPFGEQALWKEKVARGGKKGGGRGGMRGGRRPGQTRTPA